MASPQDARRSYVAAVVGATGATGSALVDALARSERFSRVVAIARSPRDVRVPETTKVEWKRESVEDLARAAEEPPAPNPLEGVDAVFCALGTTRADAGSARAFWAVDVGGPESVAKLAREAAAAASASRELATEQASSPRASKSGPRVLSLVSASGASRDSIFKRLTFPSLLHPLFYAAAKGAAEQAFVASGVQNVLVYRPGLLDRGRDRRRSGESLAIKCGVPSLGVEDLARVMVADAVEALDGEGSSQEGGGEVVRGDAEIKRRAASLAR